VVRAVVGHGMALVGVATLVGCAGALLLGRLLRTLLYGLPVRDPLTLTAAAGLLGLVALLACYLPARRASRVDPISALRAE
jgi:putative ABC transport system permease protein